MPSLTAGLEQPNNTKASSAHDTQAHAAVPPAPREAARPLPPQQAQALRNLFMPNGSEQSKVRLDSPDVRSALGDERTDELLKIWTPIHQMVIGENDVEHLEPRPFRASVLSGTASTPAILVGPPRAQGGFGKIRDALVMHNDGEVQIPMVLKEFRTEEPRPRYLADGSSIDHKAGTLNRFNRKRTEVSDIDDIYEEYRLLLSCGGTQPCEGLIEAGDKYYMLLRPAHSDLYSMLASTAIEESSALARHVGERYAEHLCILHGKGFVHVDGKLENVLVNFDDGTFALCDFGGTMRIDEESDTASGPIKAITMYSPEAALSSVITRGQDIWCMGLVLLQLLGSYQEPAVFDPDGDVDMRLELAAFTRYRRGVLNEAGEVDVAKLQKASEAPARVALDQAIKNDLELTAYIVGHLLHPNAMMRDSAEQAEVALRKLAARPDVERILEQDVLPRCRGRVAHLAESPALLHQTAEALLDAAPEAFTRQSAAKAFEAR